MKKTLIAAVALSGLLAAPVAAQTDMTEAQRAAFRAEVRAYLLENPEVLMEAIGILEARRDAEAVANDQQLLATNADAIFNDPSSWAGGNLNGDITVVEFMDYRCSYCKKAHAEVQELIATDGNIKFVVKEFPILGEQSALAARFAIAVLQQEGAAIYEQVHDTLMTLRGDVSMEALNKVASDAGVKDLDALATRMESPEVAAVIDANHALGSQMSISGTPTFIINGTMVRGYVPLDGMRKIVEEQRKG